MAKDVTKYGKVANGKRRKKEKVITGATDGVVEPKEKRS